MVDKKCVVVKKYYKNIKRTRQERFDDLIYFEYRTGSVYENRILRTNLRIRGIVSKESQSKFIIVCFRATDIWLSVEKV